MEKRTRPMAKATEISKEIRGWGYFALTVIGIAAVTSLGTAIAQRMGFLPEKEENKAADEFGEVK